MQTILRKSLLRTIPRVWASVMNLPCRQFLRVYSKGRRAAITCSMFVLILPIAHAQTDFCLPNSPGTDSTATYCTKPNFPIYGTPTQPLPANAAATVGSGLQLEHSATNLFSLVMGSTQRGANLTTAQSVRDMFYMNYIVGDLTQTLGSPMDTGQGGNNVFAAVARHYAVGDPNDVELMETDGIHLRAICSQNHTDCSPGHVYAGMIRPPAEIRPGMTVKVRYKSPSGPFSWAPVWMFSGSEKSPGPGGNPYQGLGTSTSLTQLPGNAFEIDINDNFSRFWNTPTVQTGFQLDYGTPNIYGITWQTAPHPLFWANGKRYIYHPEGGPPFEELPTNWSTGFHNLVLSWQTDNQLFVFVDGKLVAASYMEYPATTYQDGFDGNTTKLMAMNLMIGNQAIPSFAPGSANTIENDGMPDGWTIVVQEISAWNGNIVNPMSHAAAPNGCDSTCQQP